MTTNDAGLRQSQAHARAARTLSDALAHRRELSYALEQVGGDSLEHRVEDADVAVAAARKVLREAYLAYTNPFNVRKTV